MGDGGGEESRKRTDLEGLGDETAERLRKDEEEGFDGCMDFATANSEVRVGSLDVVWIEGIDFDGKPRNWDVRSSY